MNKRMKALVAYLGPPMAVLGLGFAGSEARALSLRNSSAEVSLSGLSPGRTYSLRGRTKAGLGITNTGGEPVDTVMALALPPPGELKDGYEPLPSLDWMRILSPRRRLKPGESGASDAVISLPKNRSLAAGQYQVLWLTQGITSEGLSLTLGSKVLLRISDPQEAELQSQRRKHWPRLAGFDFPLPHRRDRLDAAVLGSAIGVRLKLVNPGERAVTYALNRPEKVPRDWVSPEGYEAAPNHYFLRWDSPIAEVGPGEVRDVLLRLEIPNQARYRARRWVFLVGVEALGADPPTVKYYELMVDTVKES